MATTTYGQELTFLTNLTNNLITNYNKDTNHKDNKIALIENLEEIDVIIEKIDKEIDKLKLNISHNSIRIDIEDIKIKINKAEIIEQSDIQDKDIISRSLAYAAAADAATADVAATAAASTSASTSASSASAGPSGSAGPVTAPASATGLEENDIIIKARWVPDTRIVSFDELTITTNGKQEKYTMQSSKLEPKDPTNRKFLDIVNDQKQRTISFGYDYSSKENKPGFFYNKLTPSQALVKIPANIVQLNGMIEDKKIVNFNQAKTISEALIKKKIDGIEKDVIDKKITDVNNNNIITWPEPANQFPDLKNWKYVKENNPINYYAIILLYLSNSTNDDLKNYIENPLEIENVKTAKNYDINGIKFRNIIGQIFHSKIKGGSKTKKYRKRITNSTRYRGNSRRRTASRYRANTTRR